MYACMYLCMSIQSLTRLWFYFGYLLTFFPSVASAQFWHVRVGTLIACVTKGIRGILFGSSYYHVYDLLNHISLVFWLVADVPQQHG